MAISEYISYLELAESVQDELINDGWDDCINLELFSSGEAVAFLSKLDTDLLSEEYLSQAIELVEGYLGSIGSDENADEINLDEFTEVCSIILDTSDADLVEIAKLNSVKRIDDSSNLSKFLASQKTNALSTDQALKLYQFLEVQTRIKSLSPITLICLKTLTVQKLPTSKESLIQTIGY